MLVIIEGIDGSGKSTLAKALSDAMGGHLFGFPSQNVIGKLIRSVLAGEVKVDRKAMQHLFVADALDNDHAIEDLVDQGKTVILDRHPTISGWVYQVEATPIDFVQQISISHCFTPVDLVCIVDVPAQVAAARLAVRGKRDTNDAAQLSLIEGRRNRYTAYRVMHRNVISVDGQKPVGENVATLCRIMNEMRQAMGAHN